jgi:uncharacterized protein with HEPN domain
MRDYRMYLEDIVGAMNDIAEFFEGMSRDEFEADKKTFSAVVQQLEVIGEAVKQVLDEIRNKKPTIPWSEMAGMRDRLINAYFRIDRDLVWQVITERIPEVKPAFQELLDSI